MWIILIYIYDLQQITLFTPEYSWIFSIIAVLRRQIGNKYTTHWFTRPIKSTGHEYQWVIIYVIQGVHLRTPWRIRLKYQSWDSRFDKALSISDLSTNEGRSIQYSGIIHLIALPKNHSENLNRYVDSHIAANALHRGLRRGYQQLIATSTTKPYFPMPWLYRLYHYLHSDTK